MPGSAELVGASPQLCSRSPSAPRETVAKNIQQISQEVRIALHASLDSFNKSAWNWFTYWHDGN